MRSVKSSLFEVSLMMFSVKRSINSEAIQKIYNIFFMSAILAKVNSCVYSDFFSVLRLLLANFTVVYCKVSMSFLTSAQ